MSYGFNLVTVGYQRAVRMLMRCSEPGCSTLGFGRRCINHEPKLTQVFVRGRPWPPPEVRTQAYLLAPIRQTVRTASSLVDT
jgi:hypothetical protein